MFLELLQPAGIELAAQEHSMVPPASPAMQPGSRSPAQPAVPASRSEQPKPTPETSSWGSLKIVRYATTYDGRPKENLLWTGLVLVTLLWMLKLVAPMVVVASWPLAPQGKTDKAVRTTTRSGTRREKPRERGLTKWSEALDAEKIAEIAWALAKKMSGVPISSHAADERAKAEKDKESEEVAKATEGPKIKNAGNIGAERETVLVRRWLAADIVPAPEHLSGVDGSLLYGRFVSWCRAQGAPDSVTHQLFSRRMRALGYLRDKRSGRPVYYGIALRTGDQAQAPPRR